MQKHNRKAFLKKACLSAACMCGFSAIALADKNLNETSSPVTIVDDRLKLIQDWISTLLNNLQINIETEKIKPLIKKGADLHYSFLNMDEILAVYTGDIEKFTSFLEDSWGWKIELDKESKILIADENKSFCVCPVLNSQSPNTSAICYCSEGFAEKMFSKVFGVPVQARVVSSVRRGDKSCKYEIRY